MSEILGVFCFLTIVYLWTFKRASIMPMSFLIGRWERYIYNLLEGLFALMIFQGYGTFIAGINSGVLLLSATIVAAFVLRRFVPTFY